MRGELAPSKILLLGLPEDSSAELGRILLEQGHRVRSYPVYPASRALELINQHEARLVFCSAAPEYYKGLIQAIKPAHPGLPLVVVGRHAETSVWLEALESGATDYCVPPFESASVKWVLESALASCGAAA